jgi:hypothetical protein
MRPFDCSKTRHDDQRHRPVARDGPGQAFLASLFAYSHCWMSKSPRIQGAFPVSPGPSFPRNTATAGWRSSFASYTEAMSVRINRTTFGTPSVGAKGATVMWPSPVGVVASRFKSGLVNCEPLMEVNFAPKGTHLRWLESPERKRHLVRSRRFFLSLTRLNHLTVF